MLEDVGALQKRLPRGNLHMRFVWLGRLFRDNILLHDKPHPPTFQCKLFSRKRRDLQVAPEFTTKRTPWVSKSFYSNR